jgi:predicted lipoprotein with Yx(FWY)xxD motif
MKNITILGSLVIFALLLTACGPAASTVPTQTSEQTLEPTQPEETTSAVATGSPVATVTQSAEPTAIGGIPVTGDEETLKATLSDQYGPIIVDNEGRSLYLFMSDTQNGDSSACTEDCATEWEPLTIEGDLVAGPGTIQNLLGTITRDDGTTQVTYNGWPLYYFSGDRGGGSTSGQGAENVWFLISPSGKAIQE